MTGQGMSTLERRYRRLLKVLPRWYRLDREEEMVGIFLADRTDELDLEHSWPGWGETGSVLGLSVRTHLAASAALTSVPTKVLWRGEVVRALGLLGLLLGILYAGASVMYTVLVFGSVHFSYSWLQVLAPVVAFVALLYGKYTVAKVVAALALVPAAVHLASMSNVLIDAVIAQLLFQFPFLVTCAALCLGFHRDVPAPPLRRFVWWGGGALAVGLFGGVAGGAGLGAVVPAVTVLVVTVLRLATYVSGDVAFGRALSLFAVLMLAPVGAVLSSGETFVPAAVAAAVLLLCAVLPVRRRRAVARLS